MSSSRSKRSPNNDSKRKPEQQSVRQLIDSLQTHRVNTLTELCRIERLAASCESEEDAVAFQPAMTAAWNFYVTSNQMLSELRGLTPNYPFCSNILAGAQSLVQSDPESNRSWNFAWLCLVKINEEDLIPTYAETEAARPEMWGGDPPEDEQIQQLAACFQYEWHQAIQTMLQHWQHPPTWY